MNIIFDQQLFLKKSMTLVLRDQQLENELQFWSKNQRAAMSFPTIVKV